LRGTDQDLANGGSDRFLDAMVAWGAKRRSDNTSKPISTLGRALSAFSLCTRTGKSLPGLAAPAALASWPSFGAKTKCEIDATR
jgi:hypothetical protein